MTDPDHRLWLRLRDFNKLKRGERVDTVYYNSTKRPKVGDRVLLRTAGHHDCPKCGNEALHVTVVSVESDDAVTTTLERTDWR